MNRLRFRNILSGFRGRSGFPVFSVQECKVELIRSLPRAQSVRDYGGLWGVDGIYLEEAVRHCGCTEASMIDSLSPSSSWAQRVDRIHSELHCTVESIRADFREDAVLTSLKAMEISLLYDILLHQIDPVHILWRILEKTTHFICIAQPVLRDSLFALPNASVNLQFYSRDLKRKLRGVYGGWPDHEMFAVFSPAQWIWGQTVSYIDSVLYGFGWRPEQSTIHSISPYLDYAFLKYTPR